MSIAEVAPEAGPWWFQLYVFRDRGLTRDLVARAAGVGSQDRAGGPGEIVFITDEEYDPSLWSDAEDEGVGPSRNH